VIKLITRKSPVSLLVLNILEAQLNAPHHSLQVILSPIQIQKRKMSSLNLLPQELVRNQNRNKIPIKTVDHLQPRILVISKLTDQILRLMQVSFITKFSCWRKRTKISKRLLISSNSSSAKMKLMTQVILLINREKVILLFRSPRPQTRTNLRLYRAYVNRMVLL